MTRGYKLRKRYRTVYDMGHTIDGIDARTLAEAKETAFEILQGWLAEDLAAGNDQRADMDGDNLALYECNVWVERWSVTDWLIGRWQEVWAPSDEDLMLIGWPVYD